MRKATQSELGELAIIQNPALGAYILWRYGLGFQSNDDRPSNFALAFLVLPLILHRASLDVINSTRKGGKRRPCCWMGCVHRKDKPLSASQKFLIGKRAKK